MILGTLGTAAKILLNLLEHARGVLRSEPCSHGGYCYWCGPHVETRRVTVSYPTAGDMMITNKQGKKRALVLCGRDIGVARHSANKICELMRDELHWSTVLVNYQTPNTPTRGTINKAVAWLTADVTSDDTLFLYYCGPCNPHKEFTILPHRDGEMALLETIKSQLGRQTPTIMLVFDATGLTVESLGFKYTAEFSPPRMEPARHPVLCLAVDNNFQLGYFTDKLITLIHKRSKRLNMKDVLVYLNGWYDRSDAIPVVYSSDEVILSNIYFGVESV